MDTHGRQTTDDPRPKKEYQRPELTVWGSVTELTTAGCTNPGYDRMHGSVEGAEGPPEGSPGAENGECTFD
jgi:hypothetical protein